MTENSLTPAAAWQSMLDGNANFVGGTPRHPNQDGAHRTEVAVRQTPIAALFGCADSRLAAEIIFDKGLGDLFVVRNAGQVISDSAIGSIEYAVELLGVPLVVILAHDECGAVSAAIEGAAIDAKPLPVHIWRLIAPIVPAARQVLAETGGTSITDIDPELVGREHLRQTVAALLHSSELISDAVAAGRLGIVGANYRLGEGGVDPVITVGVDAS